MKNKARIVRNSKDSVYLEVVVDKSKCYFEVCPIFSPEPREIVALSDYFNVDLKK